MSRYDIPYIVDPEHKRLYTINVCYSPCFGGSVIYKAYNFVTEAALLKEIGACLYDMDGEELFEICEGLDCAPSQISAKLLFDNGYWPLDVGMETIGQFDTITNYKTGEIFYMVRDFDHDEAPHDWINSHPERVYFPDAQEAILQNIADGEFEYAYEIAKQLIDFKEDWKDTVEVKMFS